MIARGRHLDQVADAVIEAHKVGAYFAGCTILRKLFLPPVSIVLQSCRALSPMRLNFLL